jgi:hypothetical protein
MGLLGRPWLDRTREARGYMATYAKALRMNVLPEPKL